MNPRASQPKPATASSRKPGGSLLGLALDGDRLEAVAVRRTNGNVEILKGLEVGLAIDLLTNEPALAGREIRKHLDAAGIRERRCVVAIPLSWVLTLHVPLPDLPDEDLESILQIEAERGFPYAPDSLVISRSMFRAGDGSRHATLAAVPRDHVVRIEAVLAAAQLRPISFSLGLTSLPPGRGGGAEPVLSLVPGATGVGLLVSANGGVASLRALEGVYELEAGGRALRTEVLSRELRITMGQLPGDLGANLRRLRILGKGDAARELEESVRARAAALGLQVEYSPEFKPGDVPVALPAGTQMSPALCLALVHLTGRDPAFEFLPPKVTAWQRVTSRYSSRKLVWAGFAASLALVVVLAAFLVQQVQLWYWGSKWNGMKARVASVEKLQQQIRQFRPWFDGSVASLGVLRRLTEAFPEDGTVSARSVEIREGGLVTCTGTTRDRQSLLRALDKLRATGEVADVKVEQMRGRSTMEFSINFQWSGKGGS
jgi:hypothetical protein